MTGWSVRYADVPLIASVSAGLAALTLLLVALATLSVRRGGEAARIRAHYGQVIVDVAADSIDHDPGTVDVRRFEDLHQVAIREGSTILHAARPGFDVYVLRSNGTTYRFGVTADERVPEVAPLGWGG